MIVAVLILHDQRDLELDVLCTVPIVYDTSAPTGFVLIEPCFEFVEVSRIAGDVYERAILPAVAHSGQFVSHITENS